MVIRRFLGVLLAALATACGAPAGAAEALPAIHGAAAVADIGGNQVELLVDGDEAAARIAAEISRATASIEAEIYEFDRADILAALVSARRRGVTVNVVYDPSVAVDAPTAATLRVAGVDARPFPIGPRQIDHVKLLVVDGRVAVLGGMNWGRRSYLNHDFDVVIAGPAVRHLGTLFAADEFRAGGRGALPPPPPPDPAGLRLLTTYPDTAIRTEILRALAAARGFAFIEMFVITDPGVLTALEAAAARGVAVWLLLDPGQDLNQVSATRLRAAGIRAAFYRSRGEKLHAKAMVADGNTLVVGSANWTSSGLSHNHELDAVIEDPGLAARALARMEADWRASQ